MRAARAGAWSSAGAGAARGRANPREEERMAEGGCYTLYNHPSDAGVISACITRFKPEHGRRDKSINFLMRLGAGFE